MLDLVEFAGSKHTLGLARLDRFLHLWATSVCECWHRLLAASLGSETRVSSHLGETSRFKKGLAAVPTPANLLWELGRVDGRSVRRLFLTVRVFSRQFAVGLRLAPVGSAEKCWLAAQAVGVLLTPTALMASVLGLWAIGWRLNVRCEPRLPDPRGNRAWQQCRRSRHHGPTAKRAWHGDKVSLRIALPRTSASCKTCGALMDDYKYRFGLLKSAVEVTQKWSD